MHLTSVTNASVLVRVLARARVSAVRLPANSGVLSWTALSAGASRVQAPGGTEFWQSPEVVGTGCPAPAPTRHLPQTAVLIPTVVRPFLTQRAPH